GAQKFVTVTMDGKVREWDATAPSAAPKLLHTFTGANVYRAVISPDRSTIAVGLTLGEDGQKDLARKLAEYEVARRAGDAKKLASLRAEFLKVSQILNSAWTYNLGTRAVRAIELPKLKQELADPKSVKGSDYEVEGRSVRTGLQPHRRSPR